MKNLYYTFPCLILLASGLSEQTTKDSNALQAGVSTPVKHEPTTVDNVNHIQQLETKYLGTSQMKTRVKVNTSMENLQINSKLAQDFSNPQQVYLDRHQAISSIPQKAFSKIHDGVDLSKERKNNSKLLRDITERLQQNSVRGRELEQMNLESNQRKIESNIFEVHTIHQSRDAMTTANKVWTICSRVSGLMGDYSKGLTDLMTFRIEAVKETFLKFPTVLRLLDKNESTKGLFNVDKYIQTSLLLTTDEALSEQGEAKNQLLDNDSAKLDVGYALALMKKAVSGTTRRILERTAALEKATSLKNKL